MSHWPQFWQLDNNKNNGHDDVGHDAEGRDVGDWGIFEPVRQHADANIVSNLRYLFFPL